MKSRALTAAAMSAGLAFTGVACTGGDSHPDAKRAIPDATAPSGVSPRTTEVPLPKLLALLETEKAEFEAGVKAGEIKAPVAVGACAIIGSDGDTSADIIPNPAFITGGDPEKTDSVVVAAGYDAAENKITYGVPSLYKYSADGIGKPTQLPSSITEADMSYTTPDIIDTYAIADASGAFVEPATGNKVATVLSTQAGKADGVAASSVAQNICYNEFPESFRPDTPPAQEV